MKIEVIEKLPPPISVKGVDVFLGMFVFIRGFYGFFKIAYHLRKLIEKDCKFYINESYLKTLRELKEKLVTTPIIF